MDANKCLKEIREKKTINSKLDALLQIQLLLHFIYNGTKCDKCGVIQGEPKKGFNNYYCEHFSKRIGRRFSKENKMITNRLFSTEIPKILDKLKNEKKEESS